MDVNDDRKLYFVDLICTIFQIEKTEDLVKKILIEECLNKFLDDISCTILRVHISPESYSFSNEFSTSDKNEKQNQLIFLKVKAEVMTNITVKTSVVVMTLFGSPILGFHQTLSNLFIPAILNDSVGREPQIQNTLKNLDYQLKYALYESGNSGSLDVASFNEELRYWKMMSESNKNTVERKTALKIWEILHSVEDDLNSLETMINVDLEEIIDLCSSLLDDLWRVESNAYEQDRIRKLIDLLGNNIAVYLQKKNSAIDFWKGDYYQVRNILKSGILACTKWNNMLHMLCTVYWTSTGDRQWVGPPYVHELCARLKQRLLEIMNVRSTHRQLTRLLSSNEQKELETNSAFSIFNNLSPGYYSVYTEPLWKAALKQFEKSLTNVEQRVASKLKTQLSHLNANPIKLLQEMKRYEELIQRPNISQFLIVERENLLGVLKEYINGLSIDNEQKFPILDLPSVVNKIYWAKLLQSQVKGINETNNGILKDLKGSNSLSQSCNNILIQLKNSEKEQFEQWIREVKEDMKVNGLSLAETTKVLRMKDGQMIEVNYPLRLVNLIREVQLLSLMGLGIPKAIKDLSERAKKFMNQAKDLEQIANFHNTIGDRIIPSQKPMLLSAAQKLDSLINSQKTVTWSDTTDVDKYIANLQDVVKSLSKENNQLAFYHHKITDKVLSLLNVDIIRQQNYWKQGLRDIREIITQVEFMKFPNMKSWKLHWDYQLYKALEWQYQLSLYNLHLHFPEIKVELIYRQQKLQFHPPVEEIRMKYYSQVKRFLSVPNSFTGISENIKSLFATIITRNATRFEEVFVEAENLFQKLEKVKDNWSGWMALGRINLDEFAEQNLKFAEDWDLNFRASKKIGQEVAKLHYNDEKIGCLTISVLPIRAELELMNRKYWDALTISLQMSIIRDINMLNKYISEANEILNAQPKTVSEVGEANMKHAQMMESSEEKQRAFENTVKKNKTLASWTKEKIDLVNQLIFSWDNFQNNLKNHKSLISRQVERMKIALKGETENLLSEVEKFTLRWEMQKPKDADVQDATMNSLNKNFATVREKLEEWEEIRTKKEKLVNECLKFEMPKPVLTEFETTDEDLRKNYSVWSFYDEFWTHLTEMSREEWILFRGKTYKFEEFLSDWEKKTEERDATPVTVKILQEINSFKVASSLFKYLRGESFSDKHWMELFMILGITKKSPKELVLADFLDVKDKIIVSEQNLQALNNEAANEITIRQALGELDAWEVQAKFTLTRNYDSQMNTIMLIKDFSDVMNKIGDNQCLLQSILSSSNAKNFSDRTSIWENKLTNLNEIVGNLNIVQRKWVYLEPIFKNGSFAMEENRFGRIDQDFRYVMMEISKDNRVSALLRIINLKQSLTTMMDQLTRCQKSLNLYLQEKRSVFPRFYFLCDDDLLELLGQSTKEQVIQSHLKKLFGGINSVIIGEGFVRCIQSLQGEVVKLNSVVKVTNCIEDWLKLLSAEVKTTLKSLLLNYLEEVEFKEVDPLKYPSQILCLGEALWFTSKCEEHISSGRLEIFLKQMKAKLNSYSENLENWQEENNLLQLKRKSLLIDTVHNVNVVETLIKNQVKDTSNWYWQKQLRYYMDSEKKLTIRMVDAELEYTYEYQGNGPKLIWTPLTEKCFLTLTQAIKMGLGGNPFGPAGTGKTESVKALGGLLGRQVLVFNCDKGIDVKSMGRIFTGLVKCGAWGCFDEFNRLEEATLSAVSMIIQPIQIALQENKNTVTILDEEVPFDKNCGLFVTLNPAGKKYGGRKKLPNNLKQLFRPVVMSAPDEKLIAHVGLLCEGFKEAKVIGSRLVEVFELAKSLLSRQQHYDWGLRALKTVLGTCGSMFRENRKRKTGQIISETEVAVEALRLNTLSKLTFKDSKLFDSIVKDVFVGVKFIGSDFEKLTSALKEANEHLGLEFSETQVKKCIELYEQMQQRMGVALVGPSGTGKTTIIKLLKCGLQKLGYGVKHYVVNPKSMERQQFFGHVDLDTRQWTEGVLTDCALKLNSESQDVLSWLVCDGDIDPDWVEALNSVLDENRLLTLPSGWRIQFNPNVNFLFETSDLTYASPATVSRMGIIFLSEQIIDIKIVINSWLAKLTEEYNQFIRPYIQDYFYPCVDWIRKRGCLVVPYSVVGLVKSGLSHLENIQNKAQFVIAVIHGLGANLMEESREEFAKNVFELTDEYIPDPSRILDSYYDANRNRIEVLPTEVDYFDDSEGYGLVLTPTAKISTFILEPWIKSLEPIIICGPEGSGKTLLVKYCFSKLAGVEIAKIFCSKLVSPRHCIQKLKQVCMLTTTSTGKVLKPKNSQKLIFLLKNLELAVPDIWGTNVLITWMQQVITCQGFYDSDLEWISLERIQIVGLLTDGLNNPSIRLTSLMKIYYLNSPSLSDLKTICFIYLKSVICKYFDKYKVWTMDSKISSLVASLILIYEKIRSTFTNVKQKHYSFSPRDLTKWCLELRRYKIEAGDPIKSMLEIVTYIGFRLFGDRLVNDEDKNEFKKIIQTVMDTEWNYGDVVTGMDDVYYVSDDTTKLLSKVKKSDWSNSVSKGILMSLGSENEILVIDELLRLTAVIDINFSALEKSLLLVGKSGAGRKTALQIISALHSAKLVTLSVSQKYNIKSFKVDLKTALQCAGVDGESVFLVIESYQIVDNLFLDMLNSLLSSGEIPQLYTGDELESVALNLRDLAAAEGYSGTTASFFAARVLKNLHVALILNYDNKFQLISENYPKLFAKCSVIWLSEWSSGTMRHIPQMLFSSADSGETADQNDSFKEICNSLFEIHRQFQGEEATPRRFLAFVKTYIDIYLSKKKSITERAKGLQAGIAKLNQTKSIVDNLKKDAASQKEKLAEKQQEASSALNLIGETMRNANTHKERMETLRERAVEERKQLTERKKAIDQELAEVNPLIEEARQAVGNIKSESLSEIRSLRAPPDAIRDILEGVLRLMGIQDTSWNNMKMFLAKRGVKEDIRTFDAHQISSDSKDAVKRLLAERNDSFDPKVAKRASVAAAPLAAWVKANIKYALVLEKIRPLEKEQKTLQQNLSSIEDQVGTISTSLGEVDDKVNELKSRLNTYTKEAAVIEINLAKAQETMASAQDLLSKLEEEFERWILQLKELTVAMNLLPRNALLAAAFLSYLSDSSENIRNKKIKEWEEKIGSVKFSLVDFLASEREKLKWISEGLTSDQLSLENAVIMLNSRFYPLVIDPNGMAINWLKNHFSNENLETVSQHSSKLQTTVELSVRFGKTLIVEEVDDIHAVLMPVVRKDLICQGSRQILYVGEKPVDYHKSFKMFLITRNIDISTHPDAAAISFTVTQQGLAGQLLALAVEKEKPKLGIRRSELLKREEELKLRLHNLQENLLELLASAQGGILENKDLILSLNETKTSSKEISTALEELEKLESELDKEYQIYKEIADFGSRLYFTTKSLSELNSIYQFSVCSFKVLFQRSLQSDCIDSENYVELQKKNLIRVVYQYVSRSLFKSDRLAFALRLYSNMCEERVIPEEWAVFKGEAMLESQIDSKLKDSLPKWIEQDRYFDITVLKFVLPDLFSSLSASEINDWLNFSKSRECEKEIPKNLLSKLQPFQILLFIQAFRPDRLFSAMNKFVLNALDIKTLSPSFVNLSDIAEESVCTEPILLIVSPGADPSEELRILVKSMPKVTLQEVAIGEGQTDTAMDLLKTSSEKGDWLCLKNLHLMTSWLRELEKEFRSMKPHPDFRLWLTTEPHEDFSRVLANSCLKVTYEAPPGIKRNLQRTFASWSSETYRKKGVLFGRTMFAAAWFHAVVQERRSYIPQGWSTFYEFTDSDLRATVNLIGSVFSQASYSINWALIRGLLLNSIYGGRIDNTFDMKILESYLCDFFNESTLNKGNKFGPGLVLPASDSYAEYLQLIHQLSDFDIPCFFGLPENIERSWQKMMSSQTIDQLKLLEHSTKTLNFDIKGWQQSLSPILNTWKKLNQNSKLIEMKLSGKKFEDVRDDPVLEFLNKDFLFGLRVVQSVHQSLAIINKVIRSLTVADAIVTEVAKSLIKHQTPLKWQRLWEGPENPFKYLSAIIDKTITLQKLSESSTSDVIFAERLDLGIFFQPDGFLKAHKQLSARKLAISIDNIELQCKWITNNKGENLAATLHNLQLEGASFDGQSFGPTTLESPIFITAPPVSIFYVEKNDSLELQQKKEEVVFPVYRNSRRENLLATLSVPCIGGKGDWYKTGAAFFLRE